MTDPVYLPVEGDSVPPIDLNFPKVRELVRFLASEVNPFARLLECRASPDKEAVVLEVDVQLPQRPMYAIRHSERFVVAFSVSDQLQPEILALRTDFPLVPHLNQRVNEFPRSLCLYDKPYEEIKLHWTAATFVERIRDWLAQTAKGQLHGEDQPLEPLLFDPVEDLVLPEDLLTTEWSESPDWLTVRLVSKGPNLHTAIASRWQSLSAPDNPDCVALVVSCQPQVHGLIRYMPRTLADLHEFTTVGGLDLLDELRGSLKQWMQSSPIQFQRIQQAKLILVVRLPKTREPDGKVETIEARAFVVSDNIKQIGVDIGVWELIQGNPGLLIGYDETKVGTETTLLPANPRAAFSRSLAARVNGLGESKPVKITAIGVGALGSQVITNLVRAGFGQWTLIDNDVILPHNLGRHALAGFAIGCPKALALAEVLNYTIEGEDVALGIYADLLQPGQNAELIQSSLKESGAILDISASVSAARHLCRDVNAEARRVSLFLNPSGTALTLLAEDVDRLIPLDVLEMQFYREIVTNPALVGLLASHGQVRTGQSCRDVSVRIPQDLVAIHAGIASRAFRSALSSDQARIGVWWVDTQDYTVSTVQVDPMNLVEKQLGDWTICYDTGLLSSLAEFRLGRLPKETGGVLLGGYDAERKIIYVVTTIPSPPDSEEWPTAYIRGSKGLKQQVEAVSDATVGMLRYIGEWHSHPDGSDPTPSAADLKVLAWIGGNMEMEGLPGVIGIIGENNMLNFFLDGRDVA